MNSQDAPRPYYCALFAIFPFVFLYSTNVGELSVQQILLPCLVSLLVSILLLGTGFAVLRDIGQAACCVALLQLLFFSYGHIYELVRDTFGPGLGRHRYMIAGYMIVAAAALIMLFRARNELKEVTKFFNFMSASLFFLPAVTVASLAMSAPAEDKHVSGVAGEASSDALNYSRDETMPDVYYIILDGYTGVESLQHFFDYDNERFLDYLEEKDFHVVSDAHSNYVHTLDSLTATLNMKFADYENADARKKLLFDNQVSRNFKKLGYKYVHFASRLHEASRFSSVDVSFDHGFFDREFGLIIRETTALRLYFKAFEGQRRERILSTFENIASLAEDPDPTFGFAHIMMPHPPYIVDRNGDAPPSSAKLSMTHWEPKEMYLDQVIFLNKKVTDLVESLLTRSSRPPIIILQGDHGAKFNHSINTDYAYRILNAVHLPGLEKNPFYASITPVNTFRVLFNEYFGGSYPLLEDRASLPDPIEVSKPFMLRHVPSNDSNG